MSLEPISQLEIEIKEAIKDYPKEIAAGSLFGVLHECIDSLIQNNPEMEAIIVDATRKSFMNIIDRLNNEKENKGII